jgi:hypothetical protein
MKTHNIKDKDIPKNCPKYIFTTKLFGMAEIVYSRDSIYMFPVGVCLLSKVCYVSGLGFFKV